MLLEVRLGVCWILFDFRSGDLFRLEEGVRCEGRAILVSGVVPDRDVAEEVVDDV